MHTRQGVAEPALSQHSPDDYEQDAQASSSGPTNLLRTGRSSSFAANSTAAADARTCPLWIPESEAVSL